MKRIKRSILALCLVAGAARADKMTDAEELFRRAKALMNESKYTDACPLLEESEKLDPQMGTLLNLAICHENVGRIASAWGEFRAVEQQARVANRDDRVKLAHDRASKLEARLPRLKIVAAPDAKPAGLVVKVDGEIKGEALWSGVAVDPGTRSIDVSAPGRKPAQIKVKVDDEGVTLTVTLPRLDDAPAPPPGNSKTSDEGEAARSERYAANRSRRNTGIVVGATGAATMLAGGVFGILAIMKNHDATSDCPKPCVDGSGSAKRADSSTDSALLFANVSNVLIPLGAIAAALGGYLVLSTGPTTPPKRAFLAPSRSGAGLGVTW
jgi:hypothetical protein